MSADTQGYANYIRELSRSYPNLVNLEELLPQSKAKRLYRRECRITLMERTSPGGPLEAPRSLDSPEVLRQHLERASHESSLDRQRIYLVENLSLPYIALLGSHFNIDPNVFATQIRSAHWEGKPTENNTPKLPSCREPAKWFTLRYNEVRMFTDDISSLKLVADNSARRVTSSKLYKANFAHVGVIRHCGSFWCRETHGRGWDGIIPVKMTCLTV